MGYIESCHKKILELANRVEILEEELECKDIKHLHELRLLRDQLQAIMDKHHLK